MNKIVPHLWFDTQAAEAAEFYARVLPGSEVTARIPLRGTPSGDAELVSARFCGQDFLPISAGPAFRYAWVMDRRGLSWQVMHREGHRPAQKITPTLMFVGRQCGKAEEASHFYAGLFDGAVDGILRYPEGAEPDRPGTSQHLEFQATGQVFAAMDSAHDHEFGFNEAIQDPDPVRLDRFLKVMLAQKKFDLAALKAGWLG